MELIDKHLKILWAVHTLNKDAEVKACKKDIEKATKLSFYSIDKRLKELENAGFVDIKIIFRRLTKVQLTEKGKKAILSTQKSLDKYAKD